MNSNDEFPQLLECAILTQAGNDLIGNRDEFTRGVVDMSEIEAFFHYDTSIDNEDVESVFLCTGTQSYIIQGNLDDFIRIYFRWKRLSS